LGLAEEIEKAYQAVVPRVFDQATNFPDFAESVEPFEAARQSLARAIIRVQKKRSKKARTYNSLINPDFVPTEAWLSPSILVDEEVLAGCMPDQGYPAVHVKKRYDSYIVAAIEPWGAAVDFPGHVAPACWKDPDSVNFIDVTCPEYPISFALTGTIFAIILCLTGWYKNRGRNAYGRRFIRDPAWRVYRLFAL
jgi:hypothetical protein